jgi:sugar lactone lactonase YvrE
MRERIRRRRLTAIVSLGGLLALIGAAIAVAATGALRQPPGPAGCVSEHGSGGCANGHGLAGGVDAVAVSPDGRSVYATTHSAIARFKRNRSTGKITQPSGRPGCVSENGSGPCADGHGISTGGADSVAVTPDGKSVYVASYTANTVIRFNRNRATGAIQEPAGKGGCVSEDGSGPCADGHALSGVAWVAVSADGKSVYAASTISNAIVRFKRNAKTGAIREPAGRSGCVSEDGSGQCRDGHALLDPVWVEASHDGNSVYVASLMSDAVARFKRNPKTGAVSQPAGKRGCISEDGGSGCTGGRALSGPFSLAVSERSVYVASSDSDALANLQRNRRTGVLRQPAGRSGCISDNGSGRCRDGHALSGADGVALSGDRKSLYASSTDAVVRLRRHRTSGVLSEPPGRAACVSEDGSGPCADGHALLNAFGVAASRNGRSAYVASLDSAAVARFKWSPR